MLVMMFTYDVLLPYAGLLSFGMGCHQSRNDTQSDKPEKEGNFSTTGFFSSVCEHVPWIDATIEQHEGMSNS